MIKESGFKFLVESDMVSFKRSPKYRRLASPVNGSVLDISIILALAL